MKKIIFYLCMLIGAVSTFTSCSSDDEVDLPQIYISQPFYTMAKGSIELIVNTDKAPDTDITIPVSFGGTAVEGVDFTAAESMFVLKAGETEAKLTLTRIDASIGDDNKELYVNLRNAPSGYSFGVMNYASVTLLSRKGVFMTFKSATGNVGFSSDFLIQLNDMDGKTYKVKATTSFDLEVDESSTAIEGVHYEFVNGAKAVVPVNKFEGSFTIKLLKLEEGKDKIVLHFAEQNGFNAGTISQMTITLKGPDLLSGTWAFDKIINLDLFESYGEDISKAPTGTSADQITFIGNSYEEYTFMPNITGDFKNYFGTTSRTVTFKEEANKTFQEEMGKKVKVSILEIPNINVGFSATDISIRTALVGFRLIKVDDKDVLECTLDDFEPKGDTFGALIYGFMADMEWAPYRIYFTKVE